MGRRDDIRGRLDAATPGPWEASEYTEGDPTGTGEGYALLEVRAGGEFIAGLDGDDGDRRDDAALIAHAPSDLRDLLAVADQAQHYRDVVAAAYGPGDAVYEEAVDLLFAALDRLDNGGDR